MMERKSFRFMGGLDLTSSSLTRNKRAGALIGCMNYESREEGYRYIDGYERFDGRKSPSNILADDPGTEAENTETRREAIGEVPGTGDIFGVWRFNNKTYAFRKDSGGTARMFESGPDGWAEVLRQWQAEFTTGNGSPPQHGESVSDGSVSATVVGLYLKSGSWGDGDAAGVLVLRYSGDSRYSSNADLMVASDSGRTLSISGTPERQSLGTGEEYAFFNSNFYARHDLERMYWVTGEVGGHVWEWDGRMLLHSPIGIDQAAPKFIAAHSDHLFIGYEEGSVIHSDIGNPRAFTAVGGATEIGIGDRLTGMIPGYKGRMFLFGRNRTEVLTGTSASDWRVVTVSEEAGAMKGTVVLMDQPTCLDDRGMRNVAAVEAFGDFDIHTMSKKIRPLLDFKRDGGILPVASVRVRRKSQYRIFFNDGEVLVASYIQRGPNLSVEYTRSSFDLSDSQGNATLGVVRSICSVEDRDGRERIFFSMKNSGYVYEMDRGDSFDGHRIQGYLRFPYNDLGTPEWVKRFRKVRINVDSTLRSKFSVAADFDDDAVEGERGNVFEALGPSSIWDEYSWSEFYWAASAKRIAESRIHGRGNTISLVLFSDPSTIQPAHIFSGATVFFDRRRVKR